jgi:membrane-associated phospholipid phosphatase
MRKIISEKNEKEINSANLIVLLLIYFGTRAIYFLVNKPSLNSHDVSIFMDDLIKFNSLFVIPYVYWYAHMILLLGYFMIKNKLTFIKAVTCLVVGSFISYALFLSYPTSMNRPLIEVNNTFDKLTQFIYSQDNPGNCFPSMHVSETIVITFYFVKVYTGKLLRVIIPIFAFFIILSTVFLKQHYFLDVIGGLLLAVGLIYAVERLFKNKTILQITRKFTHFRSFISVFF